MKTDIRKVWLMDPAWIFHKGDIIAPDVRGHAETYYATKAGRAEGAANPDYDDSSWRVVDLPHDWQLELLSNMINMI